MRGLGAFTRHRQRRRLGAQQVQPGLQHMRHRHAGSSLEGAVDRRDRVADQAAQLVRGLLEVTDRRAAGSADRVTGLVLQ